MPESDADKMTRIEKELDDIHATFESRAINSRKVKDVFGREFPVPVNEEHKCKVFGMGVIFKGTQQPHLRAFWSATFGFFSCFFSVFAPSAIIPYMSRSPIEGGISLTRPQAADANSAAVASTIIMRMVCGPMCDKFGARKTMAILLSLAMPGIIGLIFIQDGQMLILCRLVIGMGLASFVTCQVWCSQMFARSVVGVANATAGGWGNLGGGVTQLVMPYVAKALIDGTGDVSTGWRLAFLLPLLMHVLSVCFILTGRDLPDGNYAQLEKAGAKQKVPGLVVAKLGLSNVNAWVMFLTYGLCFGIELCMNAKVVPFFARYYAMSPQLAGVLGSCFGLMNLFARSWGGLLSDAANKKFGMRGRIWAMWLVQSLEGLMCVIMGLITINYPNPFNAPYKVPGTLSTTIVTGAARTNVLYSFNSTVGMVAKCGSKQIATPSWGYVDYGTPDVHSEPLLTISSPFTMVKDPDPTCLHNAAPLGATMVCMIFFSTFVQMAEGLHFGVVPYVSRPALGVVSGMVGAGGNFGGVMGSRFIVGPNAPLDQGFIYLGIIILTLSLTMFGIYFPEHGGMLFKAGALGSYDPQLVKPPASMRGADQMDYANAKTESKKDDGTHVESVSGA